MSTHPAQAAIERLPHLQGHSGHWQHDLYPIRADIAAIAKPARIFEFGAYLGWALIAFAVGAGDSVRAIGWADNETGCPDSNRLTRENLAHAPIHPRVRLAHWTDPLDALRFRNADLIHVDGDHSPDGCMRDLVTGWRLRPSVVVIDDLHDIQDVQDQAVRFARLVGQPLWYAPTQTGLGLIDITGLDIPRRLGGLGHVIVPFGT